MPGTNLTRDEARDRANLVRVASYDIALDLTRGDKVFGSTTTVRFRCTQPGARTFVDLVGAILHGASLNGRELDPTCYRDGRIELIDLAADNELTVSADCTYSRTGEGLHRFEDPADGRVYLYSQFEVPDARRVYACFEQPDLKARFRFTVTAPEHWQVVSNAATPEPERSEEASGVAVWRFAETAPLSTYVTALVAGEYHRVTDSYEGAHGTIPLGLYCRQSMAPYLDIEELLRITRQGFAFFEEAFDYPYPFGKYDQLFVPEFNMGAMENVGCVTFRDDYLPRSRQVRAFYEQRANTILHEMAHMWFGDLVTMRWWDDLWLNESFAEWAAHHASVQATEYDEAWTGFTSSRKVWAYRQDQLPTTHPIAADNHDLHAVEVNFDGITYAKGAATLKQLVAWVGEEQFLAGLRSYFRAHAFGNTDLADLLTHLESASGRDLKAWADEWLTTSGVNTLSYEATSAADPDDAPETYSSFAVLQTAVPEFPTLRRHRIGVGLYDRVEGRLVRRDGLEVDVQGARTEIPELVGVRRPDLLLLNDGDLAYTKIRLREDGVRALVESIATLEDSLARALCWSAAWDMTRDAEMSAHDFVDLVLDGLRTETDMTAVSRLPGFARTAVERFSEPASRPALRVHWERGIRGLLGAAEPGSDHQLSFARAFAWAAVTDEGLDEIAGLLNGSAHLDGLVVDTDLRWTLLTALAAAGRAEEDRIAAELERDRTISGQEHAAAALAARPTPEAKEAAWRDAVERDDVPNETQRSIALSFSLGRRPDLLEPYLRRYLEAANTLWEQRGTQRASTVLEYMFPLPLAGDDALTMVDEWLAVTRANPAAVRLVREGRAEMARALRAQARDAARRQA